MRTIGDYIKANRADWADELSATLEEIKEKGNKELTAEQAMEFLFELAKETVRIYNAGFDDCLTLIEKADIGFLNQKLPHHLRK